MLPLLITALLFGSTARGTFTATVTTDKADYTPGQIVHIAGTGWLPGETVELLLHEDPQTHDDIILYAEADANGDISNSEYTVCLHDLGVTFYLTATGLSSGMTANHTFTDGPPGIDLNQVRNGGADSPNDPGEWVNGAANATQSHYAEGMSIPYRAVMINMPPATEVTLTLEYDVQHSERMERSEAATTPSCKP